MALTATSGAPLPATSSPAVVPRRELERRLGRYSPTARRYLVLAIALGVIATALVIGQAIALSLIVSRVFISEANLTDVRGLLLALIALALLRAGAAWGSDVFARRSGGELWYTLFRDLLTHFDRLGPTYLQTKRTGELTATAVSALDDVAEYMAVYQPMRALAVIIPVLVLVVVCVFDPLSALVLLATGPVLVLLLALIGSRTKEIADRRLRELVWLSAHFLDVLQGLPTLKMFGQSKHQIETTARMSSQYGASSLHLLRTAFETAFVLEMSATVATALVAVETGLRLAHGSMPFETAMIVILVTPEFFFPLRQLSARYHAGAAGRTAAEAIFELLDTEPPVRSAHTSPVADDHTTDLGASSIRFDRVTVRYREGQATALDGVSFTVPTGGTTALVGHTGAGKSTVVNLLLRFVYPESGSILVDGAALEAQDEASWRNSVAWVPQHAHLFAGTIADNIRLADPGASDEAVIAAARAARAHEFIEKLPRAYGTVLQEDGANLSGGQRQRIGIARAFLKDAPLIVLDEPTAHLDPVTEAGLQDALQRLSAGRTTLLITHRGEMVRAATHIVVLERGHVAGEGTHWDLIESCSAYRSLLKGRGKDAA